VEGGGERGLFFLELFFFIVEWLGGSGFFLKKYVERGWEGEGFYFIFKSFFRVLNG
jgi:hypothetical protein